MAASNIPTGSTTRVRRTPFAVSDPVSKKSSLIFESVDNDRHLNDKNYSRMMFYLSPLGFFEVSARDLPGVKVDNTWRYNFTMWQYRDHLFDLAAEVLTKQYWSATNGHRFERVNVSRLGAQQITFDARNAPWIAIDPLGGGTGTIPPDDDIDVFVYVQAAKKTIFESLLKSDGGLPVTVLLSYNVLEVSMETVQWSESDLRSTKAYRDLVSGGGQFVTARQVQDMIREAARKTNLYIYRDPGMENKLSTALDGVFEKRILPDFADLTKQVMLENVAEAAKIDAELRKGTGFSAEQFKPLVLIWQMIDEIKTETNYKSANERFQKHYRDNKDSFDVSMKGVFKGITGALGFGSNKQRIDDNYFKSQEEFADFKSRYIKGTGPEARIVSMGINLLERTTFENNISVALAATVVEVAPQGETTPIASKIQLGSGDSVKTLENNFSARIKEACPAGTVAAYAGERVPEGWLLCDGRPLQRTAETEALFSAIGTLYGEGVDAATGNRVGAFNVPDYRGYFLRGVDGNTNPPRDPARESRKHLVTGEIIGAKVGSVQEDAFKDHQHLHRWFKYESTSEPPHITAGDPLSWDPAGERWTERADQGAGPETRPKNAYVHWIIKYR
jgi:hypothetical protein